MANSTLQRPHIMRLGLPRSGTRSRHDGHTRYRSPISTDRGTYYGRGTTVHLRGGVLDIWRKARTTATGVPFTSTTAPSPWALINRYQAPRRRLQFTSAWRRAHTISHSRRTVGAIRVTCSDRIGSDDCHPKP